MTRKSGLRESARWPRGNPEAPNYSRPCHGRVYRLQRLIVIEVIISKYFFITTMNHIEKSTVPTELSRKSPAPIAMSAKKSKERSCPAHFILV